MKRSEINAIIEAAQSFFSGRGFVLPPFAAWAPDEWQNRSDIEEILSRKLGWDITDFGSGDYESVGLCLFTLRNGHPTSLRHGAGKVYAEKIMLVGDGQVTPLHFHWQKTEDIINRGGASLVIRVCGSTDDEQLSDQPLNVAVDGRRLRLAANELLELTPGESITLTPGVYHSFWGSGGSVMVGEVSSVNDDATDNRFFDPVGRFPEIDEDTEPARLLVSDYEHLVVPFGSSAVGSTRRIGS